MTWPSARLGLRTVEAERDDEGYRNYTCSRLVDAEYEYGPAAVMQATGIPLVGSYWKVGQDTDIWAFCTGYMKINIHEEKEGDRARIWKIQQKFTTKPLKRCQDTKVEDPLLEPPKVSGTFIKYTKEIIKDRLGNPVQSSSHEQLRGPQVEFDQNRPSVKIEQNVANLGLDVFSKCIDNVNSTPMWGLPPGAIKLSNVSWERKYFGGCKIYYTRSFDFDVGKYDEYYGQNTFKTRTLDEGTKVLHGHWLTKLGSGCAITVVTNSDGTITGATVTDGGIGYEKTCLISLSVNSPPGSKGLVMVEVDEKGKVKTGPVYKIINSGQGYPKSAPDNTNLPGSTDWDGATATNLFSQWAIDYVNKQVPNDADPQAFSRLKDRNGENTRIMLNGHGQPLALGSDPAFIEVDYYPSTNFFIFGLPTLL